MKIFNYFDFWLNEKPIKRPLIIKYLLDLTTLRFEGTTNMPIHLSGIEKP